MKKIIHFNDFKLLENYDKFQPLNPHQDKIHNFNKDEQFHKFFYSEDYTPKDLKEFKQILSRNRGEDYVILYHGTDAENPIMEEGLKRTTKKTKKSLQSQTGFVYLSIFPSMAKKFGEIGYPYAKEIKVYEVFIHFKDLVPDTDQLKNKRLWGENNSIGNSLADSFIYGHGARTKKDIPVYKIKEFKI
jgi:hypothetical protein